MLIVAGWLRVNADEREKYLAVADAATRLAREQPGCLEFVQAPDPVTPDRIVIFERWESPEELEAFRTSGSADDEPVEFPDVLDADVKRYVISAVEPA